MIFDIVLIREIIFLENIISQTVTFFTVNGNITVEYDTIVTGPVVGVIMGVCLIASLSAVILSFVW